MARPLALLALFSACVGAHAGDAAGFVSQISVGNDSAVALFNLTGENDEVPRCNETNKYSILLNTAGGQAAYQALLEAKRNKYIVRVEGTNGCKFFWKAEDVLDLTVQ